MSNPANITANRAALEMTITWDDGHTSLYPFSLLRAACPCAQCRGGHENMQSEPDAAVFETPLEDSPQTHLVTVK
ncbi:MAG: gamma-butyrobetaine hydroxylase-like domain-containing protein, partial [Anaerolineales bacterium]